MNNENQTIEQLKRAVMLKKLRQLNGLEQARSTVPSIRPADRSQRIPLSAAQQRLWFLDQFDPDASKAYHLLAGLRLHGNLNLEVLKRCLNRIVARHEILRTRFVSADGQPSQVIADADSGFHLLEYDLRSLTEEDKAKQTQEIYTQEAGLTFALSDGPLIRGRLLRLADQEYLLLLTQHHIISDGWSIGLLIKEMATLYPVFCQGLPDPMPELNIQYADYAAWQQEWLQDKVLQARIDFWLNHLDGAPECLNLPLDHARPPVQSHAGGSVELHIPPDLTAELKRFAQSQGATVFMALLAAWALLLMRLSQQSDVVIGTPVTNRQQTVLENLMGFFVNTLALRIQIDPAWEVSELLAHIKTVCLGAFAHQELPFEQVVEAVKPNRSLAYSPIFQVMLALDNTPGGDLVLPGLSLEQLHFPQTTTQFDLSLFFSDTGSELIGKLNYASSLFDEATVTRIAGYFSKVLRGMVTHPQERINQLPLLGFEELQQLFVKFNDTVADFPQTCVHQLFEQQAVKTPEAVALVYGEQSLSYAELNQQANQLAYRLLALGVQPDHLVAICVERGLAMVIGLLAILKAGGAYVPLDPNYPEDRLVYMLTDSQPTVILSQTAVQQALPKLGGLGIPMLLLDAPSGQEMVSPRPDSNPVVWGLSSQHLAYVIYTSGSTGLPKGVMIQHAALVNFLSSMSRTPGISYTDKVLAITTIAFDIAALELFLPLLNGAQVVLLNQKTSADADLLAEAINQYQPSIIQATPATWRLLLNNGWQAPAGLKAFCGGEALTAELALALKKSVAELWNLYGPTETTVWSTCQPINEDSGHDGFMCAPIGRPIANTQIYILDAYQQAVPIGVVGEIYIGGAGLAKGYLNRPELTAERFISNPLTQSGQSPSPRLYKTGDLGRWLADGRIGYVGRNDFQVKIRGFRIELGEIETQLKRCVGIKEAVVIAREDVPGDKRLVAYFIPELGHETSVAELRSQLSGVLADYMLPSALVALDKLPLTMNGKLDRNALPAPDGNAVISPIYQPPQGATEIAIAGIWQELLHLPHVGRDDDFFALGGHSLLAVQLVARLRQGFGIELALRELFARPVLKQLAITVNAAPLCGLPAIQPVDRTLAIPLSWAQWRLWFLAQLAPTSSQAYHIHGGLRLEGRLDKTLFKASLDRIVARHEVLRTTFVSDAGEPRQIIHPADGGFYLKEQDLSTLPAGQQQDMIKQLAYEEFSQAFDLEKGPLIRGCLLRLGDDEHLFFITQHHLIADGWSMGLLIHEFKAIYTAFSLGLTDPLPELLIQYPDYAVWQRQWLQGQRLQQQTEFWLDYLNQAPALLKLPTDRPRPPVRDRVGGRINMDLSGDLTTAIKRCAETHHVTVFMVLLAAWSVLMARLSGQTDIVTGTPVANRQRMELEPLLGLFVNTLALRVRLDADPSVAELLEQTKDSVLQAHAHQDMPFEQIVEAINPERSLSYSPIFQVWLNLNNTPDGGELALPDLVATVLEPPFNTTQFDLTLSLVETGEAIIGSLEYSCDLFDEKTVRRYADYYRAILAEMVAHPQLQVSQLDFISAAERQQLLSEFNPPAPVFPDKQLIHEWFAGQLEKSPEAKAVVFGNQTLSYTELNAKANQLAHFLRGKGVAADVPVGLCMERSLEMLIGILGILKAGGAYVPIDPDYPQERIAYVLNDTNTPVLLTQHRLSQKLPRQLPSTVYLDEDWPAIARYPVDDVPVVAHPLNLAYIIYTSGSTGQPKGVQVTHRNAVHSTRARLGYYPKPIRAYLLVSPFVFDSSVAGIFWTWAQGGCLCLPTPEASKNPTALADLIATHQVSHLLALPALYALLLEQTTVKLASLTTVIVAGEACPAELPQRHFAKLPDADLYNEYGPTEGTVWSSVYQASPSDNGETVPIGRPISNVRIYLLDKGGMPVPIGVQGEIYIGGAGVARGYLQGPDVTAEKFVPDPFSADGSRLYKTGDLARYRPDGALEFLGRCDHQVKIRGLRIELGEIEARLMGCPGVHAAVVTVREDKPGDKRLVAYLQTNDAALSASDLRNYLGAVLPEYMLPSAFVCLPELPMTQNGKIDRQALPAPDLAAVATTDYEAPQTAAETVLIGLWQELLGVERVGRYDHFFELGGHSLLAITLVERLQQLGYVADVMSVFVSPVLADLAAELHDGQSVDIALSANPIPKDCQAITPAMLPLVTLGQTDIDLIGASISGGIANIQDIYPLSPLQEGMLFHYLLANEGDAYLMRMVFSFDHRQRLDAFLDALQQVIDRHDILRTAIVWQGLPEAVQVVQRRAVLPVTELVLPGNDGPLPDLLAITDPGTLRLDLQRAPLFAATITAVPDSDQWLLALLNHHIIRDHISGELVLKEIQQILNGQPQHLPPSLPYRDYIAQARAVSVGEHEAFFRQQLGDIDAPTAPFGFLDVQGDGTQISVASLALNADLSKTIHTIAQQLGVSTAVLFHVAWANVLAHCTGQDAVVFGTVLTGRMQGSVGSGQAVGMFMNTLPVRVQLANLTPRQVVADTQQRLIGLLHHEHAALALAQRCSLVPASLPLFTAILNYRHSKTTDNAMPMAWDGIQLLQAEERTNYPITMSVDDFGQTFSLTAHCVKGINPERLVAYLETAISHLADALSTHSDCPVRQLAILPEPERQQLLVEFNASYQHFPQDICIHQLFERQAEQNPCAIAVVYESQSLSYAELNQQANQLAHQLIALGVKPDDRVGICVVRGVQMVVAVLAILKTGGAYVPLDPNYPSQRLAYLLEDSAPVALITQTDSQNRLPKLTLPVVLVDEDYSAFPTDNPSSKTLGLSSDNVAYVIYTSGSTGLPKGVMVTHKSLCNLIQAQPGLVSVNPDSRILQFASLSFDASVWELFTALCHGACLCLANPEALEPGGHLAKTLLEQRITHALLPPSVVALFPDPNAFSELTLIVGGEACPPDLARQWARHCRLVNAYGPTEATVFVTRYLCAADHDGLVPIGKPIPNTHIYILDAFLQPVPIGVTGEIYIAGAGLAKGYLHRPELTAERFITNPFQAGDNEFDRLYKTGDLGRWLEDGNIAYQGRNDFQVKIRGFRIELGEIEAQLRQCEGVKEAVVIAREDHPGDKRLVAYLLAQRHASLQIADVRSQLANVLSEYMLPSAYVILNELPLTANGKLDRSALPAPDIAAQLQNQYLAPQTDIEWALAAIWSDLLQLTHIGRSDRFIELGGHSLLAIQVMTRLNTQFAINLPLKVLFEADTIEKLAERVVMAVSLKNQKLLLAEDELAYEDIEL
ncbi:MAG: non-ribosomal peptide synthetase [Methylobacter sp.]|nr:MAG: non-ribosomal peptide synthetase [Methylobacter sp.]